ncbi:hypothetical protein [Glycomyces sp. NPDC048151]|uniref:hypothetical protein n=1 Tax=Glycomyces sp. NPDC048151 TaxID=3364002 RepID=UPI00371AAD0C
MTLTQSYVDLGVALIDIDLHQPYRTVFGLWRCEWCAERCKRAGCEIRREALSYFQRRADERDRDKYTAQPYAGLFSDTELHTVVGRSPVPRAPIPAQRPPSPIEQRPPRAHRRKRRDASRPRADRRRESPAGVGA